MSIPDAVQAMSIQQLSFTRLARHTGTPIEQAKTSKLLDLINKVVDVYNANRQKNEQYQSIAFELESAFELKVFAKIKKGKTQLTRRLQKQGQAKELPANAASDFLFFFYRDRPTRQIRGSPTRQIFAVSTGTAWHVVRPTVSYKFPLESVIKTLDPEKITEVARRCLVGPDTYERLTHPDGQRFYNTEALYHLVESFTCHAKKNSSLMELGIFPHPPSIKVETGLVRILHKIPLEAYPKILDLFSQHVRGEKTYSRDGELEVADPLFEFLRFLQPAYANKEDLDRQLIKKIFILRKNKQSQTVQVRHKYFMDFVHAETHEIQLESGKNYRTLERCPTLDDLLHLISSENPEAFESEETFYEALRDCSLRYDAKNAASLLSYLEGEIIGTNGNTYFKVRDMWYKITADQHGLLQQDFRSLLRDCLAAPEEHPLKHPWAGNTRQGRVTENAVKEALKITKGIRTVMKSLKEEKVSYVTKTKVNQAVLLGEVLKNPQIKKHKDVIEKDILSASALPDEKKLKELLKDDLEAVLKELRKPRAILDEKGFVLNPFAYPLKALEELKNKYTQLEEFLRQRCSASQQVQSEEDYNRSYIYTATNQGKPFGPNEGTLVIDQICPEGIEAADVIFYDRNKTLLAHIKETLGQTTRDVCSQILNAAKKIASALRLHQTQSYLKLLWNMVTEVKEPSGFRAQMREQFLHLGEEAFYKIFREREITFVYGLLKSSRQSLQKEKETRTCLTAQDLETPNLDKEKIFKALQEEQFLDNMGRLTGKFYASSKEKFTLKGFEKQNAKIYELLSQYNSVSDSTIAKFELLRTAEELRKLGFKFKIVEIEKNNLEDPASQSQQASASQMPSGSSQVPPTQSQLPLSFDIPDSDDPATDPSQQKSDKIDNGPVGFINIGNSCYINATLQILFNIPELRELIENNKTKNALLREIHALMHVTTGSNATQDILKRLRSELFKLRGNGILPGAETAQQDAQEFLQLISEQLKWTPFGIYTSITVGNKKYKRRTAASYQLQIPFQGVKTVQAAVDAYFAEEKMVADGKKIDPLKLTIQGKELQFQTWQESPKMETCPDHLILQLMRFDEKGQKITKDLEFPKNEIITIPFKDESIEYEIVGLINHLGLSSKSGHYTADLKNHRDAEGEKRSVHCDDERVCLEEPRNPEKNAYVIVLKKK